MGFLGWVSGVKHDSDLYKVGYDIGQAVAESECDLIDDTLVERMVSDEGYTLESDEDYESITDGIEKGVHDAGCDYRHIDEEGNVLYESESPPWWKFW